MQAFDPSAAYESTLQGEHVAFDTAEIAPEYHPAVHMVHGAEPGEGLYFPATHAVQLLPLPLPMPV